MTSHNDAKLCDDIASIYFTPVSEIITTGWLIYIFYLLYKKTIIWSVGCFLV